MDNFKKEIQKLDIDDFKAGQMKPTEKTGPYDTVLVQCGGCFRCGGCGGCFRCGGCFGCGGCFRCGGCFGCGGCFRCGGCFFW